MKKTKQEINIELAALCSLKLAINGYRPDKLEKIEKNIAILKKEKAKLKRKLKEELSTLIGIKIMMPTFIEMDKTEKNITTLKNKLKYL